MPGNAEQGRRDLHVDADLAFQKRSWRVQRIGWAVCAILLAAAALGFFGAGAFSTTTAGSPAAGFWVEYERFVRGFAPSELIVHVDRRLVAGDRVNIVLGGDYVRAVELRTLLPPAASAGASPDGAVIAFDAVGGPGELRFVFQIRFSRPGPAAGRVGLQGAPALETRHWVYP
ncbi:MAG TPA: hypothetical protein VF342_06175 [Alphaproteobacteria bacterium]